VVEWLCECESVCECVTLSDAEGHGHDSVGARDAVQTTDEVREVVEHAEVMFYHDDVPGVHKIHIIHAEVMFDHDDVPGVHKIHIIHAVHTPVRGDERADGHGGLQPLLHVQVTRRLVKHETEGQNILLYIFK